jgi:hypothetical protein
VVKKRAKIDPDSIFRKTEPEPDQPAGPDQPAAEPPAPKKDPRRDERATYYIDPAVRDRVKQLSVTWGVSQSQVAWYLLQSALAIRDQGELPDPPLIPSPSPAYRHNIDFDSID